LHFAAGSSLGWKKLDTAGKITFSFPILELTMSITHSDKTNSNYLKSDVFQKAKAEVEKVIHNSIEPGQAEWDQMQDEQGKIWLELRLFDQENSVSERFSPKELESPSHFRSLVLGLWEDLLQMRSEKQLKKIQQMLAERD
jgi:hypothetical protein